MIVGIIGSVEENMRYVSLKDRAKSIKFIVSQEMLAQAILQKILMLISMILKV